MPAGLLSTNHVWFENWKNKKRTHKTISKNVIGPKSKVGLSPSKKNYFICFNDSPSKMMKNAFYLMLKALFVLKIFKFLSWIFGHVEKTAW